MPVVVAVLNWEVENRREGFEYAVSEFVAPWHSAHTVCDLHGGALASASTEEDNSFIAERFLAASAGYVQSPRSNAKFQEFQPTYTQCTILHKFKKF